MRHRISQNNVSMVLLKTIFNFLERLFLTIKNKALTIPQGAFQILRYCYGLLEY